MFFIKQLKMELKMLMGGHAGMCSITDNTKYSVINHTIICNTTI
jgi:hypothetical protein